MTDSAVSWLDGKKSAASESAGSRSDFIDDDAITSWLERPAPFDRTRFDELIAKAGRCEGLSGEETAWLVNLKVEDAWQEVFRTAAKVKQAIYGNRIVLFAPLYLSNACVNDCAYCGFRVSNRAIERRTLSHDEVAAEVRSLTREGHKRLLLVAGEHAASDVGYLTSVIERIYAEKNGPDGIRRVNVNIAPLSVADYKRVRESKIGTLQVFQETYHKATYRKLHPAGTIKSDYHWRLFSQHRAQEAGISDVAIGALFGLYDWRFETVALVLHAADMDREFGVGSHTISFPRLEPAINTPFNDRSPWKVSDEDFRKIIAVLRLAVPYTGLILTARERPEFRRELLRLGVSQTDAGTRIAIGGYSEQKDGLSPEREQFRIADTRSLDEFIAELVEDGYIPSFCTADYRCGRVGCDFMQITKAGNIRKLCIPNAVLTFKEYLLDYASAGTREKGDRLIGSYLEQLKRDYSEKSWKDTKDYLARIDSGVRDLYF